MATAAGFVAFEKSFFKAVSHTLASFFASLGEGVAFYMERHSRMDEINRLAAMSDAELAEMGIARDRIVQHVFRDRFCY